MSFDRRPWNLVLPEDLHDQLMAHLFPGDGDEHGAVVAAGIVSTARGTRLLARHIFLAEDGVDFVPSPRAYRRLTPEFVNQHIRFCRDHRLVYLAVHNHGPGDRVSFSEPDMRSHERGYPALLDIARGMPVGALVFSTRATAGDIWTPDGIRRPIALTTTPGPAWLRRWPSPPPMTSAIAEIDDRQARIFGSAGQAMLRDMKIGIIGSGGVGMLAVSLLARAGFGHLVVVDPDRIEISNLPRLPEATRWDAHACLTAENRPAWLRRLGRRLATPKVKLARRIARRARRDITVTSVQRDVTDPIAARELRDCDYLILAADSHQARAMFNALVHAYLVPGVQLGTRVEVSESGDIGDMWSLVRPVFPDSGCLWCNGLVSPEKLAEEALSIRDRDRQRYVPRDDAPAPSVITLNAASVTRAVNELLLAAVGLRRAQPTDRDYRRVELRSGTVRYETPRHDPACIDCGEAGLLARGDEAVLPVQAGSAPASVWRHALTRVRAAWPSSGLDATLGH
jgi:hypothetical protein